MFGQDKTHKSATPTPGVQIPEALSIDSFPTQRFPGKNLDFRRAQYAWDVCPSASDQCRPLQLIGNELEIDFIARSSSMMQCLTRIWNSRTM